MPGRRHPLAKERFLEGNRQKWALLLICCAGGILFASMKDSNVDPEPFLTFLMMIGCVFLAGMSLDSFSKIRAVAAPPKDDPPPSYDPPSDAPGDEMPFEEEEFDPPPPK